MPTAPAFEQITYAVADGVATLTLSRPEKLNAFTDQMAEEVKAALDTIDADDDVRAVVVTGAGRGFCAGSDLSAGADTFSAETDELAHRDMGGTVALRLFRCLKPLIAAVNGPAVGVGATLQLPMDVRLASTAAKFGFVFTRRGIVPESCSSWFLPRVVGTGQAPERCTTGRVFDAQEALRGGLVRSLHEPDDLLPAAYALAREIADNTAPVSVSLTRQLLWQMLDAPHPMDAHRIESQLLAIRGGSSDAAEGVTSFLDKRGPVYPMRVSTGMPDAFGAAQEPPFR